MFTHLENGDSLLHDRQTKLMPERYLLPRALAFGLVTN
jgi:hypothetical protein